MFDRQLKRLTGFDGPPPDDLARILAVIGEASFISKKVGDYWLSSENSKLYNQAIRRFFSSTVSFRLRSKNEYIAGGILPCSMSNIIAVRIAFLYFATLLTGEFQRDKFRPANPRARWLVINHDMGGILEKTVFGAGSE